MKKFLSIFVGLIAVGLIALTVVTIPQSVQYQESVISTAVQVPSEVNNLIGIGIAAIMTAGLLFIFARTGLDLRGFADPIAVTISAYVVAELQNVINTIPEVYDPWVSLGFKILVLVLGSVGALFVVAHRRPPEAESLA